MPKVSTDFNFFVERLLTETKGRKWKHIPITPTCLLHAGHFAFGLVLPIVFEENLKKKTKYAKNCFTFMAFVYLYMVGLITPN